MKYIKDGNIATPNTGCIIIESKRIFNPTEDMLIEAGYTEYLPDYTEYEPVEIYTPARYSQLKIIRTLGDEWSIYRKQLEDAGLLDQFFAADYLQEDDPVFSEFISGVPDALKSKLSECTI